MKSKFIFLFAAVHICLKSEVAIEKYKKSDFDNASKVYPKCFQVLHLKIIVVQELQLIRSDG